MMKKLKLWQKAGLVSILTAALLAGPMPGIKTKHDSKPLEVTLSIPSAQSTATITPSQETNAFNKEDLEKITLYCLVKGEQHETEPMKYLEIKSKSKGKERKLYFEVYYSIKNDNVSASKIRFVESEYKTEKGGTDIPHNFIGDYGFEKDKDKDRMIISQRMIADGGEYGKLDGNADIMMERTVTETVENVVINVDESKIEDKNKTVKIYKGYIKEILEITGEGEIEEEIPKAMYEVPA